MTDTHLDEVRATYDKVATAYAALFRTELDGKPVDRALLTAFADLVRSIGGGPVADVGCGPGRITAHLRDLGLSVFGVDLSPGMLAVARQTHPDLRFVEGAIAALDVPDGALGGVVAWYSVIHTPPADLPATYAEFRRVLAPGGHLLLAFQAGDDDPIRLERAYGHEIACDVHLHSPDRVADGLTGAGLVVTTRVLREPEGRERTPQAYLLACRPG